MKLIQSRPGRVFEGWSALLGPALVASISVVMILNLLGRLHLSPDSSSYITAAANYVETGRLFVFVNTPSLSMEPEIEPYTEQPPGLPLYLAPFIALFREPIVSAVIAQSLALVLYFASVYMFATLLEFTSILRALALLILAFLGPLGTVYFDVLTETLFISLSLFAGVLAIRIWTRREGRFSWHLLVASLAAASSLRFNGLANLVWVVPLLLAREVLEDLRRLLLQRRVAIGLIAVGGSLLLTSFFADALPFSREAGIGSTQLWGIVLGFTATLVGLTSLAIHRIRRIDGYPADRRLSQALWPVAAAAAVIAPPLLWFLRNRLAYGSTTTTHALFREFILSNLDVPFRYLVEDLLALRIGPSGIVALGVVGLSLLPLFIGSVRRRSKHQLLLAACLAHFFIVWLPSLVAVFSPLHARLISTSIALGVLLVLNGIQTAMNQLAPHRWRYALLILPISFLLLSENIAIRDSIPRTVRLKYPAEMELWQKIRSIEYFDSSTHFFSDRIFEHQIFARIPQRIIFDESIYQDREAILEILAEEERPFLLVRASAPEGESLESMVATFRNDLLRLSFPAEGFDLYYLSE